jgi:polysaccharide pyruvyl transferase WcaK-like protein
MGHIRVLGWYGHGNCGDEAYKAAFPAVFPGHTFEFEDRLSGSADALIMGGGDIVYSHLLAQAERFAGPRHLVSVSLSSSDCVERIGGVFKTVAVRDGRSLAKLGGLGCQIPDVVFSLTGSQQSGRERLRRMFGAEGRELYQKVVLVVLNAHLAVREGWLARDAATFDKVVHDLAYVADHTSASFVFVPFGLNAPHDDRITNGWLAGRCKYWKKNLVVYDKLSPLETLDLFHAADAAVVSRLHAGIFSIIGGTPFIDLTHHDKTGDFMSWAGLSDWSVPYWSMDRKAVLSLLHSHLAGVGRDRVREIDQRCKEQLRGFGGTDLLAR